MDEGGLEDLTKWIEVHPSVRFIVIDTFSKIRPLNASYGTLYTKDYTEISMLKKIADQHSVAVVVIHHLRKASAQDELDMITGSTGLTGAADSLLILKRQRASKEAVLFISGRDIEEQNLALKFTPSTFSWTLLGQAEEYKLSKERQEILRVLELANGPLKLKDIAGAVGKKEPVVHKHLAALIEAGFVEQPGHGLYQIRKVGESEKNGENGENLTILQ
jgi:RecA-family ATPase